MDLITQGLLGSTVAQAGFSEKLGKKTAFYGFLIGLLPDFDILSSLWGPWFSLKYHRGPTHALPVLLLLSLPVGWVAKKVSGSDKPLKLWSAMAFFSLFTHPLIDWCTTYGTPLWWPFTSERFANDALPIIEPLYSLPLLIVTFIGIFNLLTPKKRKALAFAALAVSSIYAFAGYQNSQYLAGEGKKLFEANGFQPTIVRATPTMFNIRIFRIVGKDKEGDYMITYLKNNGVKPLTPIEKVESARGKLVEKALNHDIGKLFDWFSMYMLAPEVLKKSDGTTIVSLKDMRYGFMSDQSKSLFVADAYFDASGNLIKFERNRSRGKQGFKQELKLIAKDYFD
jgi:inner membrane protein